MAKTHVGPRPPQTAREAAQMAGRAHVAKVNAREAAKRTRVRKPRAPTLWKSTIRNLANVVLREKGFPEKDRLPPNAPPPFNIKRPADQVAFLDRVERTPAKRGFKRKWNNINKNVHYQKMPQHKHF